jgi:iron complex transport system substrate-binding protein
VLDWGVLATVDALGIEVAGTPSSSVNPPALASAIDGTVNAGTLQEPNFEAIAAMGPDLIIVAQRSAAQLPELARIAPTIDLSIDELNNVESSIAQARTLGAIFDRAPEAEALIGNLEASFAAIREASADAGNALMILTTGGSVSAFGAESRFNLLYNELGFGLDTAVQQEGRHGMAISFEFLVEADPDWIFVVDRDTAINSTQAGAQPASVTLDNDVVRLTAASQAGQIVYVDSMNWYILGGGVVALQGVANDVAAVLDVPLPPAN